MAQGSLAERAKTWGARLDDELLTFFTHDCVLTGKLELAWDSYGLVSAVLERLVKRVPGSPSQLAGPPLRGAPIPVRSRADLFHAPPVLVR
jgi:hypothetical protein